MREKSLPAGHPAITTSVSNLASLYLLQGRFAEAGSLYKRALELREKEVPADQSEIATILNNLAILY
jgi:Flp pilus assembly protein TadD